MIFARKSLCIAGRSLVLHSRYRARPGMSSSREPPNGLDRRETSLLCVSSQLGDFGSKKPFGPRVQLYCPGITLDSQIGLTGSLIKLCEYEECVVGIREVAGIDFRQRNHH